MNVRWRWLAIAGLLGMAQAQAAVRASLDRDHVAVGEAVTLTIVADGSGAKPDLSPLRKDFDVAGVSTGSQTSIINGSMQSSMQWSVAMSPRHAGVIEIPPLAVGGDRTSLLRLQVDASASAATTVPADAGGARDAGAGKAGDPVFIEGSVDSQHPYVGQSVIYTLRLYYAATLLDASLDLQNGDNGDLRQIGQDERSSQVVQGRRYDVLERHFLVQPEHSGVLHIPAPTFQGRAMADTTGNPFDDSMGIRGLRANGSPLEVQVRPRPAQAAEPWLPAKSVQLSIEPSASKPRAGEPFSLVVHEAGEGVSASQLPEIVLPPMPGAQVYPEPSSTAEHAHGGSLQAERVRRFAIVPAQAGLLQMPALTLPWWDATNDRAAIARVEFPSLQVEPGVQGGFAATPGAPGVSAQQTVATIPAVGALRAWQAATAMLAVLLALALAWGWRRGGAASDPDFDEGAESRLADPLPGLREALATGDPAAIARALCDAAPGPRPGHLHEVAGRLADPAQKLAVQAYEAKRWSADGAPDAEALARLRAAFAKAPRWASGSSSVGRRGSLPPLYPD